MFLFRLCQNTLNDRSIVIYHSVIELALIAMLFVVLALYELEDSPTPVIIQRTMISHTLGEFIRTLSLIFCISIFILRPVVIILSLAWPHCVRKARHF